MSTTVVPDASTSTTTTATQSGDPFLGSWRVHGGLLAISSGTQGKMTYTGGGFANVVMLDLQLAPGGNRMAATVHFTETLDGTGASVTNPDPNESFQAGDTFALVFAHPQVLQMVSINTGSRQVVGNPYWCNTSTPAEYQNLCGA